jgi:hypothetical protein
MMLWVHNRKWFRSVVVFGVVVPARSKRLVHVPDDLRYIIVPPRVDVTYADEQPESAPNAR